MAYNGLQGGGSSFLPQYGGGMSLAGGSGAAQSTDKNLRAQNANVSGTSLSTTSYGGASMPLRDSARTASNVTTDVSLAESAAAQQAAAEAARKAAEEAARRAKAAELRGDITGLVNRIKDIFSQRYDNLDRAAKEQTDNLQSRFANETQDLSQQIGQETALTGANAASRGTFDSSYRGNVQDTITEEGAAQARDMSLELKEALAKIGQYILEEKSGYKAQTDSMDTLVSRLAESTNLDELTSTRNTFDSKIAELRAGNAKNATQSQSLSALQKIAPSNARAVQLKTTLAKIVKGSAPSSQKAAVGRALISNAGLDPEDQQRLLLAFQADLGSTPEQEKQAQ